MGDRMAGKVVFITGAAGGQGRSHAVRLAEEGADIIGIDICADVPTVAYPGATPADLAETVKQVEALDRRMIAAEADVRDPARLQGVLEAAVTELGHLDGVVANAGISSAAPAQELGQDMWHTMIDINLTGVWNTCQAALSHLGDGASVVITSSTAGLRTGGNIPHYAAAKHGVVGLMRSLSNELAPRRIRVNTVHPTNVSTDMLLNDALYQVFRPDLDRPTVEDAIPAFTRFNAIPVPWVEPRDISNAVLFLLSDESRYVTAVALPVDAGSTQRSR
jgi:SDR family mycofactocin-dependent oxidoreductase